MNDQTFRNIYSLIDQGALDDAKDCALTLLEKIKSNYDGSDQHKAVYFNTAGLLVDIAHLTRDIGLAETAVSIFENLQEHIIGIVEPRHYYYNFANAKVNLVRDSSVFDLSFSSIETLVEAKNLYWKSIKESKKVGDEFPEQYVNLANCLKRQFRFSEALWYYDHILASHPEIPQAWVNRSETLLMLNTVSNTFSIKMLDEAAKGYEKAAKNSAISQEFAAYYTLRAADLRRRIRELGLEVSNTDHEESQVEFEALSTYRQFCCEEDLTLSEHGLYCSCAGAAQDDLTIPMRTASVGGEFVPQMEAVLNRLKSEFSMARRCYYEYSTFSDTSSRLIHEECFTDLGMNECLGLNYEKLRTAFRLCFGILDKIAVAICEHHSLKPDHGFVYFQNFWQLGRNNRRDKFEAIRDPGLLSLYSIATDLNEHKQGEWHEFKRLRNAMEHGFLVITHSIEVNDTFKSYTFSDDIEFVDLKTFEQMVKQMIQIARSAIFSFVFSFRSKGMESSEPNGVTISLQEIDVGH